MEIHCFWRSTLSAGLLITALAPALFIMPVSAEKLVIPLGQQGDRNAITLPQSGMKAERVRARWGSPESTHGPVGQPAISNWHYPAFVVYFENDRVIHAVIKRLP